MARRGASRVGHAMATSNPQADASDICGTNEGKDGGGFAANWRSWLLALLLIAGRHHRGPALGRRQEVRRPRHPRAAAVAARRRSGAAAHLCRTRHQWALVLRAGKCRAPFGKLLGLTVSKHFADQMVPTAGMSGNVVVVDRLQAIGASRAGGAGDSDHRDHRILCVVRRRFADRSGPALDPRADELGGARR